MLSAGMQDHVLGLLKDGIALILLAQFRICHLRIALLMPYKYPAGHIPFQRDAFLLVVKLDAREILRPVLYHSGIDQIPCLLVYHLVHFGIGKKMRLANQFLRGVQSRFPPVRTNRVYPCLFLFGYYTQM